MGADLRSQTYAEVGEEKGKAVTGDAISLSYETRQQEKVREYGDMRDEGPHAAPDVTTWTSCMLKWTRR